MKPQGLSHSGLARTRDLVYKKSRGNTSGANSLLLDRTERDEKSHMTAGSARRILNSASYRELRA